MAITYNRNEKCGEATFRRTYDGVNYCYTVDLYVGNCFLLMVDSKGDEDQLHSFFVDDSHMERCLKNGIFTGVDTLTAITINKAKCRNYKKIVSLLTEYMDDIDISVYKDGEQTWREFKEPEPIIPDIRIREIAERAVWGLHENGGDWEKELENADLDLTHEEMEYFGIYYEEEDYEE